MNNAEGSENQAALVLLRYLAASEAESVTAGGGTVRPRPARHVPVKQEPGARHELFSPASLRELISRKRQDEKGSQAQTGTAAPQGTAAA